MLAAFLVNNAWEMTGQMSETSQLKIISGNLKGI
jgi:hypothetical protein